MIQIEKNKSTIYVYMTRVTTMESEEHRKNTS